MITEQPRDLAAEAERVRLEVGSQYEHVANRDNCVALLAHIDAQDAQLYQLRHELEMSAEALHWVLDNGALKSVAFRVGQRCPRLVTSPDYDTINPPAHLAHWINQALGEAATRSALAAELECSLCGGEGIKDNDDPLWYGFDRDWIDCSACKGTGKRKHQVIF